MAKKIKKIKLDKVKKDVDWMQEAIDKINEIIEELNKRK